MTNYLSDLYEKLTLRILKFLYMNVTQLHW